MRFYTASAISGRLETAILAKVLRAISDKEVQRHSNESEQKSDYNEDHKIRFFEYSFRR